MKSNRPDISQTLYDCDMNDWKIAKVCWCSAFSLILMCSFRFLYWFHQSVHKLTVHSSRFCTSVWLLLNLFCSKGCGAKKVNHHIIYDGWPDKIPSYDPYSANQLLVYTHHVPLQTVSFLPVDQFSNYTEYSYIWGNSSFYFFPIISYWARWCLFARRCDVYTDNGDRL